MTELKKYQMRQLHKYISYSTIKMKSFDVKSSIYIDFGTENNKEDPKLEVGDKSE